MKGFRLVLFVLTFAVAGVAGSADPAPAQEVIRIGCPTKTYFPTILATVARDRGLFEKEGLRAEITIYRGGAETFEAIAAGSADLGTVAVPLVATARKRGILTKIVGASGDEWSGWILGVKADSPIRSAKELDGKKVGITSAGSGTDTLALWAQSAHRVTFSRVAVGGGGLVPNLLNNNLDAAVIYSPLSYQVLSEGKVRALIDFATAMPPNLIGGWAATEKNLTSRRGFILRGLNALYGALEYMRANPEYAVRTIAANNELPLDIARMEFEKTFLRLSRDGQIRLASVEKALELAAASGVKDMAPAAEIFENLPIKPTRP
ncbi:MAG TPA: ABC transporter substrate-binding protein [Candidatus Binatia bacterium]|nr:ABC transporter substrate-binding protein [Candidatus Binatia bacterium]